MAREWTETKEKTLRRLLKERLALSVADPTHDIQFGRNLIEGQDAEDFVEKALLKGEIKRDFRAGETGNLFVEHISRGKPSGIDTTESDYYIFVLSDNEFNNEVFVGIHTDRLRRLLERISWEVNGGDNNTSKGKLLPLTKLIKPIKPIETSRKERPRVGKRKKESPIPF